jgi:hypothetical protein
MMAGYAFSSMSLTPEATVAFAERLGAHDVDIHVSNPFVLKPEFAVWHDISKKVGLNSSVGYIFARPSIRVTSTLGEDRRLMRADMLVFKIGVVYSIF